MDEVLFGILADNVGRYLEAVDRLAVADPRAELRRLVAAWRALLTAHRPDGSGGCAGDRQPGDRSGLCQVWRVACAYFVEYRADRCVDRGAPMDGPVTG
ncbi:MAG TPA: hypothetical protein VHW44_09835 [Pseudonocardiaceae bacterium]|nr:hypothetical protein [Pseudonocardiaceae bacterium]